MPKPTDEEIRAEFKAVCASNLDHSMSGEQLGVWKALRWVLGETEKKPWRDGDTDAE